MRHVNLPHIVIAGTSQEGGETASQHLRLVGWPHDRVIDRGFNSLSQLWNCCVVQCEDADSVIIMSEAARPTRRNLELFFGLFRQGFFLVLGNSINCFGIKKQLLRAIEPFDESCGMADMIFRMWEKNYGIADINFVPVLKDSPQYPADIWGTHAEKKYTFKKWNTRGKVCARELENTCTRDYDLGVDPIPYTGEACLPWDFSKFSTHTKFFKAILPPADPSIVASRLPELAIIRAHREFAEK